MNPLGFVWLAVFTIFMIAWIRSSEPYQLSLFWLLAIGLAVATVVFLMRRMPLELSWLTFGGVLIVLWLRNNHEPAGPLIFEFLAACLVFFALEGMELAYTELRDKDPEQLPSKVGDVILEINKDPDIFYNAREFIVVLLLAWLTISADFVTARFPIIGPTQERGWTLAFSLIFTSVLLIWLAQAPSKKLATTNSVAFLTVFQFGLAWRLLRPIGHTMKHLQMTYPAQLVARPFERLSEFRQERNLPPSRRSFYIDALKCYGYGYQFVEDRVTVHPDTSAHFHHRSLIYFTETAMRSGFTVSFLFDSNVRKAEIALQTFAVPVLGESLKSEVETGLRAIFDGKDLPPGFSEQRCSLTGERDLSQPPKKATFLVHSPEPLPSCVVVGEIPAKSAAVRLVVEVEVEEHAFKLPKGTGYDNRVSDYWEKKNVSPCGEYTFSLKIEPPPSNPKPKLANFVTKVQAWEGDHVAEFNRVERLRVDASSSVLREKTIYYPLIGATYRLEWEVWPS